MRKIDGKFHSGRAVFYLLVFMCCILIGVILRVTAPIILPITISALLTFVFYPLVSFLKKQKVPVFLSIMLVVVILVVGLGSVGFVLFTAGSSILAVYPKYENRITEIYIWMAYFFELPFDEYLSVWQNIWGQLGVRTWVRGFAFSFSNVFISFIATAVLVTLFVVFTLLETSYFKEKLDTAFDNHSDIINRIGHDFMNQVTQYLVAKFFISLANGVVFAVAFYFIGLEFSILWGMLQFVLNFIPTLGSISIAVAISLFALIQFWPEPGPVILVVAIVLAVNMICNVLDPKITGDRVGISPLMILASLAFWGWIWGFAGMVIAVPMTVIIKIICENISFMEPISIILGSRKSVQAKRAEREKFEEQKNQGFGPEKEKAEKQQFSP